MLPDHTASMASWITTSLQRPQVSLDVITFYKASQLVEHCLSHFSYVFLHIFLTLFPAGESRKVPVAVSHGSTSTPPPAYAHTQYTFIWPASADLSSVSWPSAPLWQPLLDPPSGNRNLGDFHLLASLQPTAEV